MSAASPRRTDRSLTGIREEELRLKPSLLTLGGRWPRSSSSSSLWLLLSSRGG